MSSLPEVPTFAESGYRDMVIEEWFGYFAPQRTRPDTVATLARALHGALQSREFVEFLATSQSEPEIMAPNEFAARIRSGMDAWKPIVQASGFTAEVVTKQWRALLDRVRLLS